jgi:1-acyl-sn-glycerol-3-phosphate acyltransferase
MTPATATAPARPQPQDPVGRLIARRVRNATTIDPPNETFMRLVQNPIWDLLSDRYFRVEVDGFDRVPDEPSLLIGVHSGGALTIDAWTLVHAWYRHFGRDRVLHGTAHDLLMAAPGLGDYFRASGVIPASRRGFVRQAIRSGVPIVPVATVGGHDTVFVLSEGRFLARATGLGKRLRGATMPIVAGFPFPLAIEILPSHLPLPAKIRTELLEPIRVDDDPARADDGEYVDAIYDQVQSAIQTGMERLAARRRFPVFG